MADEQVQVEPQTQSTPTDANATGQTSTLGSATPADQPQQNGNYADEESKPVAGSDDGNELGGDSQDYPEDELNSESESAYSWQASEYVHNHKGFGWYLGLIGGIILLIAGAALLHYWPALAMFAIMGVAIAVYAHKPPRTLTYELTSEGIVIEGRLHSFRQFRSFGVIPEADWHTIDLEPTQRFRPRMAVLFDPKDLEAIVDHMEQHLPRIDRRPDLVERLTQYLRF